MKAVTFTALAVLFASPALAEPQCLERGEFIEILSSAYGETRHVIALERSGGIMEWWANDLTGTWTLTMSPPAGPICIVASGEYWQPVIEALPPQGQPG